MRTMRTRLLVATIASLTTAALMLVLGIGRTPTVSAATLGMPEVFNSGNASELITTLKVTKPPAAAVIKAVFCIDLGTPPVGGDVLDATGSVEVTNDLGFNVAVETHLMFTTSCTATDGGDISENSGMNDTPSLHHLFLMQAGTIIVETGNSRQFVVLLIQSASTAAQPTSTITINTEHGREAVKWWRTGT